MTDCVHYAMPEIKARQRQSSVHRSPYPSSDNLIPVASETNPANLPYTIIASIIIQHQVTRIAIVGDTVALSGISVSLTPAKTFQLRPVSVDQWTGRRKRLASASEGRVIDASRHEKLAGKNGWTPLQTASVNNFFSKNQSRGGSPVFSRKLREIEHGWAGTRESTPLEACFRRSR